jgi:hypothetical protein
VSPLQICPGSPREVKLREWEELTESHNAFIRLLDKLYAHDLVCQKIPAEGNCSYDLLHEWVPVTPQALAHFLEHFQIAPLLNCSFAIYIAKL